MQDSQVVQMLQRGQDDLRWFDANISRLIAEFNNKFIAFGNKEVVESDSDLDSLMSKLKKKNIDISNIFIKFVSKIKYIL